MKRTTNWEQKTLGSPRRSVISVTTLTTFWIMLGLFIFSSQFTLWEWCLWDFWSFGHFASNQAMSFTSIRKTKYFTKTWLSYSLKGTLSSAWLVTSNGPIWRSTRTNTMARGFQARWEMFQFLSRAFSFLEFSYTCCQDRLRCSESKSFRKSTVNFMRVWK